MGPLNLLLTLCFHLACLLKSIATLADKQDSIPNVQQLINILLDKLNKISITGHQGATNASVTGGNSPVKYQEQRKRRNKGWIWLQNFCLPMVLADGMAITSIVHKDLLGPILCWQLFLLILVTSVYYVPSILFLTVGNLAGFFVFLTMTVFVLLTLKILGSHPALSSGWGCRHRRPLRP